MTKTALINGKLIDPFNGIVEKRNILLDNGKVLGIGYVPDEDEDALEIIDLEGCVLVPNVLDIGANLREPGGEDAETIVTGAEAAVHGGITAMACSPHTDHPLDSPETISYVRNEAMKGSGVPIYPIGALTKGCEGEQLSELALMKEAGAVAFSTEGAVFSDTLFRNALEYAASLGLPLIIGPSGDMKASDAVMRKGAMSTILGVKGQSSRVEETLVRRVMQIMESVPNAKVHISPVTTAESVNLIKMAKERGMRLSAGTAPQYLRFTEQDLAGYDRTMKVVPPLKTDADTDALIQGLKEGVIDVLSSQHMPCMVDEKRCDLVTAAFGMSTLDAFLPSIVDLLWHEHGLDLLQVFAPVTTGPWSVLGLKKPPGIAMTGPLNLTVLRLGSETRVGEDALKSKGKNSPYLGQSLKGKVERVYVDGLLRYQA